MTVTRSHGTGPFDYPGNRLPGSAGETRRPDATTPEGALIIEVDGEERVRFDTIEEAQQAAKLRFGSEAVVQEGEHFILKAATAEDIRNFTSAAMSPNTVAFSVSNSNSPDSEVDKLASTVLRDNMSTDLYELQRALSILERGRDLALLQAPNAQPHIALSDDAINAGINHRFDNPQVTVQEQMPELMAHLNEMAPIFGFNDGAHLVKQFRKMNSDDFAQLQEIIHQAYADHPDLSSQVARNAQIDEQFSSYLQGEVSKMFADDAQPTFEVAANNQIEGRTQWDSVSTLALYNSLLTRGEDDLPGYQTITSRPVTFVRAAHPVTDFGRHLMGELTRNMQVAAKENTSDVVTLFDAAITGSPDDIVHGDLERAVSLIMSPPSRVGHPPHPQSEIEHFGLDDEQIETTLMNPESEFYQQYGARSMQDAMSYVIRTRALNKPNRYFDPPLQPIPKAQRSDEMTPEAQALLQRVMTEMSEGPREDLLRMFTIQAQKMDASAGLQNMLNEARVEGAEIKEDGLWGNNTRRALKQFQLQQHISAIIENIDDDTTIPSNEKADIRQNLNRLFGQLQGRMSDNSLNSVIVQTERALHQILHTQSLDRETESTLRGIQQELGEMGESDFVFRYQDIRGLIDDLIYNWFDIMHTGDNTDTAEQLMTHELTHISVHRMLKNDPDFMRNWVEMGWKGDKLTNTELSMAPTLTNDATGEYSSDYASTNPDDDVAENVRTFLYQPERLLSYGDNHHHNLMKFLFINNKTNTYTPDQVIELIDRVGISREDVQSALREILGHGSSMALSQAIIELQQRVEHPRSDGPPPSQDQEVEQGESTEIPPFELMELTTRPAAPVPTKEMGVLERKSLSDGFAKVNYGAAVGGLGNFEQQHVRFTSELSTALGSQYRPLFEHYDIDPNELILLDPSDPGFALQHMVEQFQILYSSEIQQDLADQSLVQEEDRSRMALEALDDFSRRGIESFPSGIQEFIPADVAERLSDPQNRAVYRALGNILANAPHLNQWDDIVLTDEEKETLAAEREQETLTPDQEQEILATRRRDAREQYIAESMGSEVYEQLPESFRLLLRDEDYLSSVTGQYGDVTLNMNTVIYETFKDMQRLDDEVEKSFMDALKPMSKLVSTMQKDNRVEEQTVSVSSTDPTATTVTMSNQTYSQPPEIVSLEEMTNNMMDDASVSISYTPEVTTTTTTSATDMIKNSSYYEQFNELVKNIENTIDVLNQKRGTSYNMPSDEALYQLFTEHMGAEGEQVSTEGSYYTIYKNARAEMVEEILQLIVQPASEEGDSTQEQDLDLTITT